MQCPPLTWIAHIPSGFFWLINFHSLKRVRKTDELTLSSVSLYGIFVRYCIAHAYSAKTIYYSYN